MAFVAIFPLGLDMMGIIGSILMFTNAVFTWFVTSYHHGFLGAKEDFDLVPMLDDGERSDDGPVKSADMEKHMGML
jgi:hypothetical protein